MKRNTVNYLLMCGYILCGAVVFICNIFGQLDRWVVGAWIAMAVYILIQFVRLLNKKEEECK